MRYNGKLLKKMFNFDLKGVMAIVISFTVVYLMIISPIANAEQSSPTLKVDSLESIKQAEIPVKEQAAIQALRSLLAQSKYYTAKFHQTLRNRDGVTVEQSTGTISLSQPDKLRWDIASPMVQTLLVNGALFYQYDADIDQLIIEPLSGQLAYLSGLLLVDDETELAQRYKVQQIKSVTANTAEANTGPTMALFSLAPKDHQGSVPQRHGVRA